jgi:hypothetical protein
MDLTNKWMNDPTFLAQSAHFFGAMATIMTVAHFTGRTGGLITAGVFTAAAIVKEFWYDLKYELPKQSFADSFLDFTFYMVGVGLAAAILWFGK